MVEGVVRATSSRRGRGRLKILTARITDDTGEIRATWFNQPWLEAQLTPGHARPRAREAQPLRLPGRELRPRRGDRDRRLRPCLPGQRGARAEAAARARRRGARARARRGRSRCPPRSPSSDGLPLRADALVALHRPRSPEEAEEGRRRLAFDELLVLQLALARRAAEREALVAEALPAGRRAAAALPGGAAVHADRGAGAGDRRDRPRPRADDADAAPAAGRRRLGEDRGRARDAAARRRGRPAGRADGADRGPRRAALPHDRGHLRGARRPRRAPHERARSEGARERAAADRLRRRRRSRSARTR